MTSSPAPVGNLTIRQLELFLVASRASSFSEAARRLDISQPALSAGIAKIERQLGVSLFDRKSRSVSLTSQGTRFAVAAADLVRIYRSSIEALRDQGRSSRSHLHLAIPPTLGAWLVPTVLTKFQESFPDCECVIHDVDRKDAISMLLDRTVEIAIMNDAPRLADLASERIGLTSFVVVVARSSPLAARKSVGWRDLADQPLVLAGTFQRRGYLQDVWREAGYELVPRYEVNEFTTGLGLAAAGLGYVLLPRLYMRGREGADVVILDMKSDHLTRPLEILYRKDSPMSAEANTFLADFREVLRSTPS